MGHNVPFCFETPAAWPGSKRKHCEVQQAALPSLWNSSHYVRAYPAGIADSVMHDRTAHSCHAGVKTSTHRKSRPRCPQSSSNTTGCLRTSLCDSMLHKACQATHKACQATHHKRNKTPKPPAEARALSTHYNDDGKHCMPFVDSSTPTQPTTMLSTNSTAHISTLTYCGIFEVSHQLCRNPCVVDALAVDCCTKPRSLLVHKRHNHKGQHLRC